MAPDDVPFAYYARPAWQRLCIIFAGPFANGLFAAFIFMQLATGEAGAPSAVIAFPLPETAATSTRTTNPGATSWAQRCSRA